MRQRTLPNEKIKQVNIKLPKSIYYALRDYCFKHDISFQLFLTEMIEKELEHYKTTDNKGE